MSRLVRLLLLLAGLIGLLLAVRHCTAEPGPTRPEVLPGEDRSRRVFDLLAKPQSLRVVLDGRERDVPGDPTRYLLAQLTAHGLILGWLDQPESAPAATLTVPAQGRLLEAYVDLHSEGLAVVEVWAGYTPDQGRQRVEMRFTP